MVRSGELRELIGTLLATQKFGVLSTLSGGQPYGNLVAFGATEDLRLLLFATGADTGKYRRILDEPRVALLVDDRSNREEDFRQGIAVTALGEARLAPTPDRDALVRRYLAKHPSLAGFVGGAQCAFFCVDVERYLVSGFRDVKELGMR